MNDNVNSNFDTNYAGVEKEPSAMSEYSKKLVFDNDCLKDVSACAVLSTQSSKNDRKNENYPVEYDCDCYEIDKKDVEEELDDDNNNGMNEPAEIIANEFLTVTNEESALLYPSHSEHALKTEKEEDAKNTKKCDEKKEAILVIKQESEKNTVKPHNPIFFKKPQSGIFPVIQKEREKECGTEKVKCSLRTNQGRRQQDYCKRLTHQTLDREKLNKTHLHSQSVTPRSLQNDAFFNYLHDVYVRPFGQIRKRHMLRFFSMEHTKKKKLLHEAAQWQEYIIEDARNCEDAAHRCGRHSDVPLNCALKKESGGERIKWVPFSRGVSHLNSMSSLHMHSYTKRPESHSRRLVAVSPPVARRQQCELRRCVYELLDLCENNSKDNVKSLGFSYSCVLAGKYGHRQTRLPDIEVQSRRVPLKKQQKLSVAKRCVCDPNIQNEAFLTTRMESSEATSSQQCGCPDVYAGLEV